MESLLWLAGITEYDASRQAVICGSNESHRGFNSAGVVRSLHAARPPFIMPQAVHGKASKDGTLRGLRAIRARHPTGWTTSTWKPTGQRRVTVALCVLRRRRRDRRGHRTFRYACWGITTPPRSVDRVYRLRFGVETSYRPMHQARIRTSSRRPAVRYLFVAVALLLRNLWVRRHWLWRASRRSSTASAPTALAHGAVVAGAPGRALVRLPGPNRYRTSAPRRTCEPTTEDAIIGTTDPTRTPASQDTPS